MRTNIHLDFMQRARFCDPTGGFATMGVIMGVSAIAGGVQAYGQNEAGKAESAMYRSQASNASMQAKLAREAAEQNKKFIAQNAESNIAAVQLDASMKAKQVEDATNRLTGTQKATSAAMGVGGGSVTQADILADTLDRKTMDQIAIRYDADATTVNISEDANYKMWGIENDTKNLEWALDVQRGQYEQAAKNSKKAGQIQALGTILSTASSTAAMGVNYGLIRRGGGFASSTYAPAKIS